MNVCVCVYVYSCTLCSWFGICNAKLIKAATVYCTLYNNNNHKGPKTFPVAMHKKHYIRMPGKLMMTPVKLNAFVRSNGFLKLKKNCFPFFFF